MAEVPTAISRDLNPKPSGCKLRAKSRCLEYWVNCASMSNCLFAHRFGFVAVKTLYAYQITYNLTEQIRAVQIQLIKNQLMPTSVWQKLYRECTGPCRDSMSRAPSCGCTSTPSTVQTQSRRLCTGRGGGAFYVALERGSALTASSEYRSPSVACLPFLSCWVLRLRFVKLPRQLGRIPRRYFFANAFGALSLNYSFAH